MACVRNKKKGSGSWDEHAPQNRPRAGNSEGNRGTKNRRQESYASKNVHNNKQRHVRERHDSSNSNPPQWKPNRAYLNDPLWDDTDQHFPALVAAPPPKVNVWEERKAKAEMITAIQPKNENDEEAMLQWALELSKQQAAEEEENRRKIEEQCKLQEEALKMNPELWEDTLALDNFKPSLQSENDAFDSSCLTKEHPLHSGIDQSYGSSSKRGQLYSNENNAENKINKIINCFGGWGLDDNSSGSKKLSNFVDEVIKDNNVSTTEQHYNPQTHHKSKKESKKHTNDASWKKLEKNKPITANGWECEEILYDGKGTFTDPDKEDVSTTEQHYNPLTYHKSKKECTKLRNDASWNELEKNKPITANGWECEEIPNDGQGTFTDPDKEDASTTEQHYNPLTHHKSKKECTKLRNDASWNELEKNKPITANGWECEEIPNNGQGTFTNPDNREVSSTPTDGQCAFSSVKNTLKNNLDKNAEVKSHTNILSRKDLDLASPSLYECNSIDINHKFQSEKQSFVGSDNNCDARSSEECKVVQPDHDFDNIWETNASKCSHRSSGIKSNHDFEPQRQFLDNPNDVWVANNATDSKHTRSDNLSYSNGVCKTEAGIFPEHEIFNTCTTNEPQLSDEYVFKNNCALEAEDNCINADNDLGASAKSESPPIMPPKPAPENPPSGSRNSCDSTPAPENMKAGVLPTSDPVINYQNEVPFIPPQFPMQPQFPYMNPFYMNMYAGIMNMNPMMTCAMDPMFMLRNPHFASQLLAMENYYKSFAMLTGGYPMQPQMMSNLNPSGFADHAQGVVQTTNVNSLPGHQSPNPNQALNANPSQALNANPSQALNANSSQALNANPSQALNANLTQALNSKTNQALNTKLRPVRDDNQSPPGFNDNIFRPNDNGATELEEIDWLDSFLSSNDSSIPPPKPATSSVNESDSFANNESPEIAFPAPAAEQIRTGGYQLSPALQVYVTKTKVTGWSDSEDDADEACRSKATGSEDNAPAMSHKDSTKFMGNRKLSFRQPASRPQFSRFQKR